MPDFKTILLSKIKTGDARVAIMGLGYVGLLLSVEPWRHKIFWVGDHSPVAVASIHRLARLAVGPNPAELNRAQKW
jgi:UDP-N-acetyl-D-mannosaminuronate dehydrogenase